MKTYTILASLMALGSSTALAGGGAGDTSPMTATVYEGSGMLVIRLGDDRPGTLVDTAGYARKNAVHCFRDTDVAQYEGGLDRGCYVGVTRAGRLVAPKFMKGDHPLGHIQPDIIGDQDMKNDTMTIEISGAAGNALALWIDCNTTRGDLTCTTDNGMAGKYNWHVKFGIGQNGKIKKVK